MLHISICIPSTLFQPGSQPSSQLSMASRLLSVFLLMSLISSTTTADHTGVKVRITDRVQDILKDLGLQYLEEVVNKTSEDFSVPLGWWLTLKVRGLKFTHVDVDPAQTFLRFQENSGLQFETRGLNLAVKFGWYIVGISTTTTALTVEDVNATLTMKLKRNQQGQLNVETTDCQVGTRNIEMNSNGLPGSVYDTVGSMLLKSYVSNELCPAVNTGAVPKVNTMLEKLSMTTTLHESLSISIDYSISGSIEVTSRSVDVPFRGLVFRQGDTADLSSVRAGADPVFTENHLLAYVGISEFVFNSAAVSIYRSGPFKLEVPEIDVISNGILKDIGLPQGPVQVQLTEAPNIAITKKGLSASVAALVKSLVQDPPSPVTVTCQIDMKVDLKGRRLVLTSKDAKCNVSPDKGRGWVPLVNSCLNCKITDVLQSWFDEGVFVPLPDNLTFTETKTEYHDGFVMVGGNLNFTSDSSEYQPPPPETSTGTIVGYVVLAVFILIVIVILCCVVGTRRQRPQQCGCIDL